MKIWIAQMEVTPGQPWVNLERMRSMYAEAVEAQADLVVFPELCLSGYLLGDLWEELSFVRDCVDCGEAFAIDTGATAAAFGNVYLQEGLSGEDGRPRKYNAICVAQYGRLRRFDRVGLSCLPKALMPNYREFDDSRHFYSLRQIALECGESPASLLETLELDLPNAGVVRVGFQLCEDGWDDDYGFSPTSVLAAQGAQVICNLSASPYTKGKASKRGRVFAAHAAAHQIPIVYVNQVGVQNNGKTYYAFDGRSSIYWPDGAHFEVGLPFESASTCMDLRKGPQNQQLQLPERDLVAGALRYVLDEYLRLAKIQHVVIGASGGIDSAVAASLFASVIGGENMTLVNMPSRYNSDLTKSAAAALTHNLGAWEAIVPVEESVALTRAQIDGLGVVSAQGRQILQLSEFALENVQARDRSSRILAAVAAARGGVFTCNANKAEITVGYSTLYGDHGGFLAPLGDLWKHEVYDLGRQLDEKFHGRQVIPTEIYDIIPSAELSPRQDVNQGLGDPLIYWYHDRLFRSWVENWQKASLEDLLRAWLDGSLDKYLDLPQSVRTLFGSTAEFVADLERWWNNYRGMGVVKRVQAPPVIALSRRAYGFDHRESILSSYMSPRYLQLKEKALLAEGV